MPQIYVAGFTKTEYKEVLMLSEWMIEKPYDFDEDWYVVPCPKGIRTLLVAFHVSSFILFHTIASFLFWC